MSLTVTPLPCKTRKLSYRKDDRAMRYYGCLENFRESLPTPTATSPNIFNGLLFRLSLNVRTKLELRSFTRS